ncbi:uncharacterized protein METZ01_LOCUS171899 [marine metagenome]|uniref:Uncharacterized protein n=1 Tax=marine metagenome TaxID=408172 RepID=A0A382BYZ2_9ZZZZ
MDQTQFRLECIPKSAAVPASASGGR